MAYYSSYRYQRYDVNKTIKNLRTFSLNGGMVTQNHPELLADGQSVLLENVDILNGQAIANRGAYAQTNKCDVIYYHTFDEMLNTATTFNQLSTMTFNDIRYTGLSILNNATQDYYQTMDAIKNDGITFNTLVQHTFDEIKNTGILGKEIGNTQGYFRYNTTGADTDIVAIKGKLYTVVNTNTYKILPIQGMPNGFQTTTPIEAVQYGNKLYIASGSGILVYDGTTVTQMTAYAPNGLEALYIGMNGYAVDPTTYLSNTTGAADVILGVTASSRYGLVNKSVTFTSYIQSVVGDVLEYLFETMAPGASYVTAQNWSTANSSSMIFGSTGDYSVRVSLRKQGTTPVLSQYVLPKYTIKSTLDKVDPVGLGFANLSTCTKIFIHYDRLCIYGDTTNPNNLYISHLDNFSYFPISNIIVVNDPLRGAIQKAVQFRNFLVLFTDGSIQQLAGTDPTTFVLNPVHTTLGTVQPYSVQVMQNYVVFVGNDNGIYILKTFNYASADDRMNVARIDNDIKDMIVSQISQAERILSCVYNNQYYLYVQTAKDTLIWRFYYDLGLWVRDRLSYPIKLLTTVDNLVTGVSVYNGVIYKLQKEKYFDNVNTVFNIHIISKDYDMNMPHHRKKMKQFQLLSQLTNLTTMTVTVYGDNAPLVTQPVSHDPSQNSDADKLKVTTSGRFRYVRVDITIPVVEDIQILGYAFIFKLNTPK